MRRDTRDRPYSARRMTIIDTSSAVFKDTIVAYRSARQAGEMEHPAFMAAMQVYEGRSNSDTQSPHPVRAMTLRSPPSYQKSENILNE